MDWLDFLFMEAGAGTVILLSDLRILNFEMIFFVCCDNCSCDCYFFGR